MKIDGIINQIGNDKCFLNIDENTNGIEVWSNAHGTPTFLYLIRKTWGIIVFENQEEADLWKEERKYMDYSPSKVYEFVNDNVELIYQKEVV